MTIKNTKYPIALMTVFIWVGFVCSISFMESWLKFYAPTVTVPIGLSIGRLIFNALNKVEWVFTAIVIICTMFSKKNLSFTFFYILVILLLIQTFFLMPGLNERVEMTLQGHELSHSYLHFYYLFTEIIKVICLVIFGISLFRLYEAKILLK